MKIFSLSIPADRLFRFIFHIVLWTTWISFPFFLYPADDRFRQFAIAIIPIVLSNIPLFLINSDWLIPRIFRKRGLGGYLLSLLILIAVYTVFQMALKEWVIPDDLMHRHWDVFWSMVNVLFVTGISTGYGFIVYMLEQEKAAREAQEEQLKSELSFLRSQISPHFIFNILNSIVYLIRTGSSQAEPVIIKLSELMRYMLYGSGDVHVPLEKELDYLKNYIELQKIRFEEDVDIQFKMAGSPGSYFIEPMLMIPFVENAFKHGVGLIKSPVIDISLTIENSKLHFFVKNKFSDDPGGEQDDSSGIGLRNVRRRLELLYPGFHELQIQRKEGWFEVKLELQLGHPGKLVGEKGLVKNANIQ
jgi:two-component system LytT family sensor kinase